MLHDGQERGEARIHMDPEEPEDAREVAGDENEGVGKGRECAAPEGHVDGDGSGVGGSDERGELGVGTGRELQRAKGVEELRRERTRGERVEGVRQKGVAVVDGVEQNAGGAPEERQEREQAAEGVGEGGRLARDFEDEGRCTGNLDGRGP